MLRLTSAAALSSLLLGCPASRPSTETQAPAAADGRYPAAEGFDQAGSDPRAVALADSAMSAMGGYAAWAGTRYLAWSFFGGQY